MLTGFIITRQLHLQFSSTQSDACGFATKFGNCGSNLLVAVSVAAQQTPAQKLRNYDQSQDAGDTLLLSA